MGKEYNIVKREQELQQRICNIISYTLWLYEKKLISERTKDELLKLCNPISKGSDYNESRRIK